MLESLAQEYKFQILAMEVYAGSLIIHLLVDCRPQFYISDMIKIMKESCAPDVPFASRAKERRVVGRAFCGIRLIVLGWSGDRAVNRYLLIEKGRRKKSRCSNPEEKANKIISSYGVELRKQNISIRQTQNLPFCCPLSGRSVAADLCGKNWSRIEESKKRFNAAEHLVHTTKRNPARFDFDFCFPKMPSYFRRAAVQHALGSVSSYRTRLEQWKAEGEKTGKPYLKSESMPCLFFTTMSCTVKTQKRKMRPF